MKTEDSSKFSEDTGETSDYGAISDISDTSDTSDISEISDIDGDTEDISDNSDYGAISDTDEISDTDAISAFRVLIIGSGGREYAISEALSRSQNPPAIYFYGPHPNPGILEVSQKYRQFELITINREAMIASAIEDKIDLAIIGPEIGLAIGLVNELEKKHILCVGPNQLLAQIETSKIWTRKFLGEIGLERYNPIYKVITFAGALDAHSYCESYVIKADGLKSGKGVKLSGEHLKTPKDTNEYVAELLAVEDQCLIEQKIIGREFSLITFSDGKTWVHAPPIQDFKRAYDGDTGPNTGGMGCFACPDKPPWLKFSELAEAQAVNEKVLMNLNKMSPLGYRGFLYGSYMLEETLHTNYRRLMVIEFNARLGDPEGILLLDLLESDFFEIIKAMATGQLSKCPVKFRPDYGLVVYLCPKGYPDKSIIDSEISLNFAGNCLVAGSIQFNTKSKKFTLLGSRAIAVINTGPSARQVVKSVEELVNNILSVTPGLFARSDLGSKLLDMLGLTRLNSGTKTRKWNETSRPGSEGLIEFGTNRPGGGLIEFGTNRPGGGLIEFGTNRPGEGLIEFGTNRPGEGLIESGRDSSRSVPSTYQQAGVNIQEANLGIQKIKDLVVSTHTSRVVPNFGAFGGLWDLDKDNYLAVSTDGVGTKVELVLNSICPEIRSTWRSIDLSTGRITDLSDPELRVKASEPRAKAFAGLGKDLFAANFNDLLCLGSGIVPMFFTDYFSASVLNSDEFMAFVDGLSQACRESKCALIGGETAELKTEAWRKTGINHYEMVGQIVARLPKDQIYKPTDILVGDLVLGLDSSGPHTNGYTLINSLWRSGHLREFSTELIQPHRLYYSVFEQLSRTGLRVKGVAHITGGGFIENPPRILPTGVSIEYDWPATAWPPVFQEIQRVAQISEHEMMRTFNCGIGMILIVSPIDIDKIMAIIGGRIIGRVQPKNLR